MKEGFVEGTRTNEVVGKRNKRFQLLYFNKSRELAKLYLEQRGEDDIPELWTVGRGDKIRPAKYETLYNWTLSLRKLLEQLTGEYLEFNPHSYRHASLENFENGTHYVLEELGQERLDLNVLKALANHESIETTMLYLKNKDEQLLNDTFGI